MTTSSLAICSYPASLNLRTLCNELGEVKHKAYEVGIQLGISHSKLMELKQQGDLLAGVLDCWLSGNAPDIPITWESVVEALESTYVGETGCANKIKAKYFSYRDERG